MRYGKLTGKEISFDTETTGLNPWGDQKRWGFYPARPFAFSFCDAEGETKFFRWEVDPKTRQVKPRTDHLRFMQVLFSDPTVSIIGHNIGYDIRMCEQLGLKFKCKIHDTLIMMHVVTGGSELQYGLKFLGKKYLEVDDDDEKELQQDTIRARNRGKKLGWCLASRDTHGKEPIKADYWMANPKLLEKYAVRDAERAMMLFALCKEEIETTENLHRVYTREMKLFHVVKKMEDRGVRLYPKEVDTLEKFYKEYMVKQKKIADANGGKGMNFKSSKQKLQKFITERGHKPIYFTKKGNPSINGDFLVAIKDKDPLASAILEYNGASHGIVSFLKPYRNFMVEENGCWVLHPNYKQCGPVTGRFSCSDPNLMQVASETSGRKRTEIALHPRRCFGPREGYIWYAPDYSQIEVWIFSFFAQEPAMMKALLEGHDFHGAVGKQSWGDATDYEANKGYYRKRAKLVLFCKLYGGGKKKTAYLLDCTEDDAGKFIAKFDSQLPGVTTYMQKMVRQARNQGVIVNPFGRQYKIDPDFSYKAVNYMIQGSAADMMKNSMIHLDNLFTRKWKGCHLLLTLHDELIIEVPLKLHSKKLMRDIMVEMQRDSKEVGVPVPLPVSMKVIPKQWSDEVKICDKHLDIKCKQCENK